MTSRVLGAFTATVTLVLTGAGAVRAQAVEGDRYGPEPAAAQPGIASPAFAPASGTQDLPRRDAPVPGRVLSWPGKIASLAPPTEFSGGAPASVPTPYAGSRRSRRNGPASARRASAEEVSAVSAPIHAAVSPPSPVTAAGPHYGLVRAVASGPNAPPAVLAGAPVRPLPQSIYDRPVAAPAPAAPAAPIQTASVAPDAHPGWSPPRRPWSGAYGENVRLYSVHRAYGLKPDPAPIPPQFFAATADVSNPAGPISERRTVSGSGTAVQAARAVQASDADTSSSAQP